MGIVNKIGLDDFCLRDLLIKVHSEFGWGLRK